MNILITGGAGGIGSTLCIELAKNGHTVVALDDRSPINPVAGAAVVAMDVALCLPTLWEEVPFTADLSP